MGMIGCRQDAALRTELLRGSILTHRFAQCLVPMRSAIRGVDPRCYIADRRIAPIELHVIGHVERARIAMSAMHGVHDGAWSARISDTCHRRDARRFEIIAARRKRVVERIVGAS